MVCVLVKGDEEKRVALYDMDSNEYIDAAGAHYQWIGKVFLKMKVKTYIILMLFQLLGSVYFPFLILIGQNYQTKNLIWRSLIST